MASKIAPRNHIVDLTEQEEEAQDAATPIPERKFRTPSFPVKLMIILSDSRYAHIAAWMPEGKSFAILNPEEFCQQVLPATHWKKIQYIRFIRRLGRWGFVCEQYANAAGIRVEVFSHDLFIRSRPSLTREMTPLIPGDEKAVRKSQKLKLKTAKQDSSDSSKTHKRKSQKKKQLPQQLQCNKKAPMPAHPPLRVSRPSGGRSI